MSCCFKGSAKKEQPNIQTREYYRKKFNKKSNWRLNDREFFDLVQRFNKFATKEIMTLDNYRMMMGVLGNTFMTERMFQAMDKDKDNFIDLEEYLTYNDIISNGNIKEKREQNFAMLNDNKDSVVTYDEFEQFVFNILDMYSRTISEKINANKKMVRDIFDKIARRGKDSFTFEDYMEALERDPNLFVWLEKPKEMLNEILNEQEGHYSKKFVDETIDLMFKYIATTEFAMKRILKYVADVKGESLDDEDQDNINVEDNLLLNINKGGHSRVGTFFSRKQGAYDEIERAHTKDHKSKRKFDHNSVKKYKSAAVNERSEDYE
jgi:Ca2+-binding EF-hand superfamily protein